MSQIIVKPAGIGDENKYLALLIVIILAISSWVVSTAESNIVTSEVKAGQLDARDGLNAIEQGLHSDLKAASEDVMWLLENGEIPTPQNLADELLPPFAQDVVSEERGAHQWSLIPQAQVTQHDALGYIGISHQPTTAGSFLLRVKMPVSKQTHSDKHADTSTQAAFSIWIKQQSKNADASATLESDLKTQTSIDLAPKRLLKEGWLEVVSHFNASVTRPGNE